MDAERLQIHLFPCLEDNYAFLLRDAATGATASIDSPDAAAILRELDQLGWGRLDFIFNTHHHADHAGGNLELKAATGCRIVGPRADRERIPGIDIAVGEGDEVALGACRARVIDTPGHTRGHIVYVFEAERAAFVGDTLFALGCGRLFEGTPTQMWTSLQKLLTLPDDTRVYCAHEYTQKNARFALSLEPDNPELRSRSAEIERLRASGLPTIPVILAGERRTNPFLRADSPALQAAIGQPAATPVEVFTEIRLRRNRF